VVPILCKDCNMVAVGWIGDLGGPYFRNPCTSSLGHELRGFIDISLLVSLAMVLIFVVD